MIMENRNSSQSTDTDYLEIPDLGKTGEIELIKWYVKKDDVFHIGDEMCDLVTDKAVYSLEAPYDGKVLEILIPEKKNVKIGDHAARVNAFFESR